VLAGGRSSRMGRDKALLPLCGRTLVEHVAAVVKTAARSVILVGNPSLEGSIEYPAIPDLYPGQGPLGGILTVLQHTTADWNLVTACDMPELTPGFLSSLFDAAAHSGAGVLMPAGPSGLPEPLCAVYHRDAREPIHAAFNAGIRKVTAAFDGLRTVVLPVSDIHLFQNVNTPQDWAAYAIR